MIFLAYVATTVLHQCRSWSRRLSVNTVLSSSPSLTGLCQPRKMGTVGAEPFSAKLRYTGTDDPKHPNLIKVTVTMPHIDGRSAPPGRAAPTDEV